LKEARVEVPRIEAACFFSGSPYLINVSLLVEKPCVTIETEWPDSSNLAVFEESSLEDCLPRGSRWVDWRWKCSDGLLYWPAIGLEARMTLEKTAPRQWGHLTLESGSSCLQVEALQEEGGVRVETNMSHCDLRLFQPWMKWLKLDAQLENGNADGWIHLEAFRGEEIRGCAHLDVLDAALQVYGVEVRSPRASLDWDGPLKTEDLGLTTRLRCECINSSWRVEKCGFKEVDAQLSYYSDLGIKWEIKGLGQVKQECSPIAISSKGFWSDHSKPWLNMECLFSEGRCTFSGDFVDWTVDLERVQPFWGMFAQELFLHDPSGWAYLLGSEEETTFLQNAEAVKILNQWEWKEGEISSLFHFNEGCFRPERLEAKEMLMSRKGEEEVSLGCDEILIHFTLDGLKGNFTLEGVHFQQSFSSGDMFSASNWCSLGEIHEGRLHTSEWEGQINLQLAHSLCLEPATFDSAFSLSGSEEWVMKGHCHQYPFLLQASREQKIWSLAFEGGAYLFPHGICLNQIGGHLTLGPKDWSLDFANAEMKIRDQIVHLQAMEWMKIGDTISFDFRLRQGFLDLARLAGNEKEGVIYFDSKRTEVLGQFVQMDPWSWKEPRQISASLELPWTSFLALEPICQAMGVSVPSSLKSSLSGTALLDFCYSQENLCELHLRRSSLFWQDQPLLWTAGLRKTFEGWSVHVENEEPQHQGSFDFSFHGEEGLWIVEGGRGNFPNQMSCLFSGQCDEKGRGQMIFTQCHIFSSFSDPFSSLPVQGKVEGKGCLSFDLASFFYEIDGDLSQIRLDFDAFHMKNKKPVHAFFSPSEGLMLQGIDAQISLHQEPLGECQINLLHWEPSRASWLMAQTHIYCLEEAGSILFKEGKLSSDLQLWDPRHEIDLALDIECASDLSKASFFIKEGFLPLGGQLRHMQNVFFHLDREKMGCEFQYLHQNHDLKMTVQANRGDRLSGQLILEEPGERLPQETPLTIDWHYFPEDGLSIHSIQGSLGGINASFYLQNLDTHSHLIGSAAVDFHQLSTFLPFSVAEVFTELGMGKGYEIKGRLQIDRRDLSQLFFQGIFGGKQVELFGYQFRTCSAQIDTRPDQIQINDFKISDPAGLFTFDQLIMKGEKDSPWVFHIPLISISEFRPTLLQTAKGEPGEMSPLVIRKMTFRDMQGVLEDRNSYTADGELSFINSYKRERTIFDIPSEVLGRIIGLDIELLVPVCGTLHYALEEGRFKITSLEEAYSEGGRSQFFLVSTAGSPGVDLDGNVQIQVKMKQYVLFKLTEAFTISIDGTLKHPQYHLQKNRK
jgi:hypothetical protein